MKNDESTKYESPLASMPFAYRSGSNPCCGDAQYDCSYCGLNLMGSEVGYVKAGEQYANGEFAACPMCGELNQVFRDER